jgi:hypothetical protein
MIGEDGARRGAFTFEVVRMIGLAKRRSQQKRSNVHAAEGDIRKIVKQKSRSFGAGSSLILCSSFLSYT